MQFVTDGPEIPDALLQAHEEGRVVFFCGAGISYPAGLPGFKGLVEQIYLQIGTDFSEIEREAFDRGQFDATLDLLERRLPGQRLAVRSKLENVLKPKLRRKGATDTQEALLRLGRSREGSLRLVTTNFDRIFHAAAKRMGQVFQAYTAPTLPIPKSSRWDGLVYLHGLLPARTDCAVLDRLVVTSGDFGLAYLTERWAARFVSELFRNYSVCFVGYSINDPILRYMMDALAADRMLGEVTPKAWALGECEPGQEQWKTAKWEAKGVTPILYTVPKNSNDHSTLHQTLNIWAETYRDGVQGKEAIVVKHALSRPQESTKQEDFVGRMLWALSDSSGLPAKRFANINPAPPLDWLLEVFSDRRFQHCDLPRFRIPPQDIVNDRLRFSLTCRPAPYDRAPPLSLVLEGVDRSQWDDVMLHLAHWLVRHLDDPRLVIWIAERGGKLHDRWRRLIEDELDRFADLERDGKTAELEVVRLYAPKAIPGPQMRILWRVLLSGQVKSPWHDPDLYRWLNKLKREGLNTTLRLELRELLAPKVVLRRPYSRGDDLNSASDEPLRVNQLVDWELVTAANYVRSTLHEFPDEIWKPALPELVEEFQQLLRDALDLFREFGEADDRSDPSHWDLPSITPHWQNRGFHDWVVLIELLRDAWLEVLAESSSRATRIAQTWYELPFPAFKRLALFAASQDDCIPPEQWVGWLLADNAWWLWAMEAGREVFRLFVLQGGNLAGTAQERLEAAILAGPPREMYRDCLEEDRWQEIVARSVWLRLSKLSSSSLVLGAPATTRLKNISNAYPRWQLEANEREEFFRWMSATGDPDYEDSKEIDIAPRKRRALAKWITMPGPNPKGWPFSEDTWRDVCRTRFFISLFALCDLAKKGVWPADRWREALQVWAENGMVLRSWRYAAPLVQTMPIDVLQEVDHALTCWMKEASKSIDRHEDILLNLCRLILALPLEADSDSRIICNGVEAYDPVGLAINHPVGHAAQVLIDLWFKQSPNDNDLLPANLRPIFTQLCDVEVERFRHGRVVLGSRLIAFFRVDRSWTENHLLPLFDWNHPVEAKAVWGGFLWSPSWHQRLLIAFKAQFLNSAIHYASLGAYREQFATFLTYAALGPAEGYTVAEFRSAINALPQDGLEKSAQALSRALDGAADQREDYWRNRAQPFWQEIWPKTCDKATPRIAESLARLLISAGGEFPAAFEAVQDWLQPIDYPDNVVRRLYESKLCKRFPVEALSLLKKLISDQQWTPGNLGECLDEIKQASPQLEHDPQYNKLREYIRRRG